MKNLMKINEHPKNEFDMKELLSRPKVFFTSQKQLHPHQRTTDICKETISILNAISRIWILHFVKGEDALVPNILTFTLRRKTRHWNILIMADKVCLLLADRTGDIVTLQYLLNYHIGKVSKTKKIEYKNSSSIICGPSVWKVIISETIRGLLNSPNTELNLQLLCQNIFKLHLNLNESLASPEATLKKLNTKGSAPVETDKGLVSDSVNLMLVVLGWTGEKPAESIEIFNANTQKWSFFQQQAPFMRAYHGVALLGSYLYIIGGFNGYTCLPSTLCLNMASREWGRRSHMSIPRCYVFTLAHKDHVYAIGGHNGMNRVKSCERYDPKKNKWVRICDMMYRRSDASGAELNGKIFLSGGFDGFQLHSTTEMYDPEYDQWTLVGRLIHPRSGHCMMSVDGHLFAMGGFNGSERLREVEKFNEQTHRWEISVPMLSRRSNFCSVVFQQEIYVIGGYDGTNTISNVEKFDMSLMEWQRVPSLQVHRSAAGACVVKNAGSAPACDLNELVPVVSTDIEEPSP